MPYADPAKQAEYFRNYRKSEKCKQVEENRKGKRNEYYQTYDKDHPGRHKPYYEAHKDYYSEKGKEWRLNNPEYQSEWRSKNREAINAKRREARKELMITNPDLAKKIMRDGQLRTKFGISVKQYHNMIKAQNNTCPICKNQLAPGTGNPVDHDHKTGKIREILCPDCNATLGYFNDDIPSMQRTIEYLKTDGIAGIEEVLNAAR